MQRRKSQLRQYLTKRSQGLLISGVKQRRNRHQQQNLNLLSRVLFQRRYRVAAGLSLKRQRATSHRYQLLLHGGMGRNLLSLLQVHPQALCDQQKRFGGPVIKTQPLFRQLLKAQVNQRLGVHLVHPIVDQEVHPHREADLVLLPLELEAQHLLLRCQPSLKPQQVCPSLNNSLPRQIN